MRENREDVEFGLLSHSAKRKTLQIENSKMQIANRKVSAAVSRSNATATYNLQFSMPLPTAFIAHRFA
jgi:hypothetical protein